MKLLEIKNVTKRFGGLFANNRISFDISQGEIIGLVGPNGAGKTTLFNCISGYYPPTSGNILFEGREIKNSPPYKVCARGIARTFQIIENFQKMTVLENMMVGAFKKHKYKGKAFKKALKVSEFIELSDKNFEYASDLSPPEQRRLGLGMALATEPKLLMLDEVMAGLTPKEIDEVLDLLRKVRDSGVTLIVIEHLMRAVMSICERIFVLDYGEKIAEGNPEEIAHDEKVIQAYLGKSYAQG
ncbi:MAG: ABC transporter ATP-binding protein [Desulfobacteraceae bacterium]|nr:ABC transporter ATP-binding protein [Desulfobacteraceae bacterium]